MPQHGTQNVEMIILMLLLVGQAPRGRDVVLAGSCIHKISATLYQLGCIYPPLLLCILAGEGNDTPRPWNSFEDGLLS